MEAIIFDLFGTLIDKEKYDYNNALRWLANTYFDNRFDELQKLSLMFKAEYMKNRRISYTETSFFEQLTLFEKELDITIKDDYRFVELNFIRIFREEKLINGVVELLDFLYNKNQRIYILTNSLFSGDSLKVYLKFFEIEKYIKKVYSSADIGFRKPSKEIFSYVLADIGVNNPNKVLFIGDSLEKDYDGARESGLIPILIGSDVEILGLTFDNMNMLLKYLQDIL